jgi:hypothetical protein
MVHARWVYSATTLNYIDYCCRDDFGLGIKEVSGPVFTTLQLKQDTAPDGNDTVLTGQKAMHV